MKTGFLSLLVLCLLAPVAAWAESTECYQEATTQLELNACADQAFQEAATELKDTLKALKEKISPAGADKLDLAQRKWEIYRDAQCDFDSFGSADGSIHPMVLSQCYRNLTADRTYRLQEQMDCDEGDVSCGGQ